MLDPRHIWNVICTAQTNKCHPPTSPNFAPAAMTAQNLTEIYWKQLKRHLQCPADPSMNPSVRNAPCNRGYFLRSPRAFCIEKYNIALRLSFQIHQILRLPGKVTLELHQVLRLPWNVTLELHQVLRLPRKKAFMVDPRHTWNVIYNARSYRSHPPTSPKIRLPRKMTRMLDPRHIWHVIYNAQSNRCHPPTSSNIAPAPHNDRPKSNRNLLKRHLQCAADPSMIREWSENEPVSLKPAAQLRLLVTLAAEKIQHVALRLSFEISPSTAPATKSDNLTSPSLALARKSDTWTSPSTAPARKSDAWTSPSTAPARNSDTWTSPSAAPATNSDTWTSPSTAPVTKSDTWTLPSMAPATKSDTWTSPSTGLSRKVTLELHQVPRL